MKAYRHRWMDILRGLAILLVVNHHVVSSVYSNFSSASPLFGAITELLSPLRMPVLMFLSGLLVSRSISKGLLPYIEGKARNVAYPFLVWTLLLSFLFYARKEIFHEESPILLIEALTIDPYHYLWFLYDLFWFYILIAVAYMAPLEFVAIFYFIVFSSLFFLESWRFLTMFLFFLAGGYFSSKINEKLLPKIQNNLLVSICTIFALSIFFICEFHVESYGLSYSIIGVLILPIVVRAAIFLQKMPGSLALQFLGRNSIVIYLAHVPLAMTLRVIIEKLYSGNTDYVYPILMALVLGLSVGLSLARNKFALVASLFSMPKLNGISYIHRHFRFSR